MNSKTSGKDDHKFIKVHQQILRYRGIDSFEISRLEPLYFPDKLENACQNKSSNVVLICIFFEESNAHVSVTFLYIYF